MMWIAVATALLLAFANGANDNFKGVATLYGSSTTSYRLALVWGTLTTLCGSALSVAFAHELLLRFSGKGLVADEVLALPGFGVSIGFGAAATVLLASRLGFPISTTHAILGAMIGSAVAESNSVAWGNVGGKLVLPLLLSPLVAIVATMLLYVLLRQIRIATGVTRETCVCSGPEVIEVIPSGDFAMAAARVEVLTVSLGSATTCRERYAGTAFGVDAGRTLDALHFLSAGLVGFARGLNDTPKIAALLLMSASWGAMPSLLLIGIVMAIGGVSGAKRVAESLSHRITQMNAGQGFTANAVTAFLVTCASRFGMPVSTTHVSCGALFGIGTVNRQADWSFIRTVLAAWCITAPVAGVAAYASRWMLSASAM